MNPLRISILLVISLLAGCDSQRAPATPAQYEQAKADCQPHGGLSSVEMVYALFRPNRVDAACRNEVRISRDAR